MPYAFFGAGILHKLIEPPTNGRLVDLHPRRRQPLRDLPLRHAGGAYRLRWRTLRRRRMASAAATAAVVRATTAVSTAVDSMRLGISGMDRVRG